MGERYLDLPSEGGQSRAESRAGRRKADGRLGEAENSSVPRGSEEAGRYGSILKLDQI